jgi:hypothetical protein
MNNYFIINGYWRDDKSEFENYIVSEYNDFDEDIFFHGLSESDIIEAINNPEASTEDFVITSYEEVLR